MGKKIYELSTTVDMLGKDVTDLRSCVVGLQTENSALRQQLQSRNERDGAATMLNHEARLKAIDR